MRQIEDSVGRQRLTFERITDERGTDVLLVEDWVEPGGDVPPHLHPEQEERFLVLDGQVEFTLGREKRVVGPGGTVVVPPKTRHAFRNTGTETAHMRVRVRPARDLEAFLTDTAALGSEGYMTRVGTLRLPRRPGGMLKMAQLALRYRENTVILMPPLFVQRLLGDPLARLADAKPRTGHCRRRRLKGAPATDG